MDNELAEFPHIRREIEKVKAFFSRQADRFRRAYDRANRDWPAMRLHRLNQRTRIHRCDRQSTVLAYPVGKPVDIEAIERDREQLWAEAVYLYRQGFNGG